MSYSLTIEPLGRTIEVNDGQTILDAALREGIYLPHACCHGLCATCKIRVLDGEVDLIFNTPHGQSKDGSPRRDGWEIRSAAILADVPCVTTVQGLSACVQGIEALRRGAVGVRSLQEWSADVRDELANLD